MYLLESIKQSDERGWRLDWIHRRRYFSLMSLQCKSKVTSSVDRQMSKTELK